MKMTYTGVIAKNGKEKVYVQFVDGRRNAEGEIPEAKIIHNEGFEEKEVKALELYLSTHKDEIYQKAKEITILSAMMK